jgi:hypothetical protein
MPNREIPALPRRQVLRAGLLAGLSGLVGCGAPGVTLVTNPPRGRGTRARLARYQSLAEQAAARKKEK